MKRLHFLMMCGGFAAFELLFPCSLLEARSRKQIIVRIDDVSVGPPVVTVQNAPNDWELYTGPAVADPTIEDGGIITLFGVDPYGNINPGDAGVRFVDPKLPANATSNATDIVWIQHDWNGDGSLQIGFNTREDGKYYLNPALTVDGNAGPAKNQWVTVYSDKILVLQFNPHTP